MSICLGCLKEKKLKNVYCVKCIKDIFDGIIPLNLDFNKKEFYIQRKKLAPRMSISGVQDKISLKFENNTLITTATNGKYILKPIPSSSHIKNKDDVIFNEHLSMLISKEILKIPTASCGLIKFNDGEMAYITKRFDYELSSDLKYDQEDFASILDVSSAKNGANYKYDAKTYTDCANAIKLNVSASVVVLEDFFKRILLNYLISNGDAHLKNFSLYSLSSFNDYMLTPNYDILNTRYHIDEKYGDIALDLMDDFTSTYEAVGYYTYADFALFARYLNIQDIRFNKIINIINNSLSKVINLVNNSFLSQSAKEYYIASYQDRLKRINCRI
jgi:serine/threonine-protein kinase HipA